MKQNILRASFPRLAAFEFVTVDIWFEAEDLQKLFILTIESGGGFSRVPQNRISGSDSRWILVSREKSQAQAQAQADWIDQTFRSVLICL